MDMEPNSSIDLVIDDFVQQSHKFVDHLKTIENEYQEKNRLMIIRQKSIETLKGMPLSEDLGHQLDSISHQILEEESGLSKSKTTLERLQEKADSLKARVGAAIGKLKTVEDKMNGGSFLSINPGWEWDNKIISNKFIKNVTKTL